MAPKVWATQEIVTAADLNVVAAQAFDALKPSGNLAGLTNVPAARAAMGIADSITLTDGTMNVLAFGADSTGVASSTAAFAAAVAVIRGAGGGVLYIPPGVYKVDATTYIPANTTVRGAGRGNTIVRAADTWPVGHYAFFENDNWNETDIVDTNIVIKDMTLDYADFGPVNPSGGGQHAISMRFARYVTVSNIEFQLNTAEDATAFRHVHDGLVTGCFGYEALNCTFDHWDECERCAVIGCYAESSSVAQMVNFNAERTGGPNVGRVSRGFILANNHFKSTDTTAAPVLLSPLNGACFVRDVVVTGNVFDNCSIVLRAATQGAAITGNTFRGVLGGVSAIAVYSYLSADPVGITISGNTVIDPETLIANLGVIRCEVDGATIIGNTITGSTYGVVPGIYCGTKTVILTGNSVSNNLVTASAGAMNSVASRIRNNDRLGFYDTALGVTNFRLQNDDNFVLTGTDGAGNPRTLLSIQQRSSTSPLLIPIVVSISNQLRQPVSATVAAAGTTLGTATPTSGRYIVVTSCTAGVADGVLLQDGAGAAQTIWNKSSDTLKIYGWNASVAIDGGTAGAAVTLAAGAQATFVGISATVALTG